MANNNWSGQPNGRIDLNKMTVVSAPTVFNGPSVNTGKYMQTDAAHWLETLINAGRNAGHSFYVLSGEDLYRDYNRQVYFWNNQKALGIVAAYPGTSNHGWGLAADVQGWQNGTGYQWLQANAAHYNYKLGTVPSEKWHWLYTGPTTTTAGGGINPIPAENYPEEETMYRQATTAGKSGYARAGMIYSNDHQGVWRALTNLEGNDITSLSAQGRVVLLPTGGDDLELIFATDGIWEQVPLDGTVPWSGGQLIGLGALTGRLIFPGSAGIIGQWHYPVTQS